MYQISELFKSIKKVPIWILVIGVAVIGLICVDVLSNPKTNAVIDDELFEDEALNSILSQKEYDADYSKEDSLLTGHTWKEYSFYYQNGQFVPYKGEVVTSEYVGSYKNGSEIISELNSDTTIAKLQYIKRENGYLQINIARDYDDYLSFSHRTYKIDAQNQLELTDEEEGCYKVNLDDENEIELPYEIIEEYNKEENG
jgi:hypothetical protein